MNVILKIEIRNATKDNINSACPGPPARARVQMEAEGGVDLCSEQQ